VNELLEIMRRLRDPDTGCPWDIKQTFNTIAPYTIEEAYEVAEAIDQDDLDSLKKELGDLLFQVVFYAQMAEEQNAFKFDDVVAGISSKLTSRHPHVFADKEFTSEAELKQAWENAKLAERQSDGHTDESLLASVPKALPALSRATKLGKRAASQGFDWETADDVLLKISEELAELAGARADGNQAAVQEEFGDLLLAMTSLGRHLSIDPEEALRLAANKFEQRFRAVERLLVASGKDFSDMNAAGLDELWGLAKAQLSAEHNK